MRPVTGDGDIVNQPPRDRPPAELPAARLQEARRSGLQLAAADLASVRNGRPIFTGLSFVLSAGEAIAVRGPNGAGKSTLLRMMAGLLTPSAGHIALTPKGEADVAGHAHYLGHLDGLKTALTVAANLDFWRRVWGAAGPVTDALEAVGLGDLSGLPVGRLSAGQRRRLALGRLAVAARPIWLLDEPYTALDRAGEALLGGLIERHLAVGGMALIATHRDLPVRTSATITLGRA